MTIDPRCCEFSRWTALLLWLAAAGAVVGCRLADTSRPAVPDQDASVPAAPDSTPPEVMNAVGATDPAGAREDAPSRPKDLEIEERAYLYIRADVYGSDGEPLEGRGRVRFVPLEVEEAAEVVDVAVGDDGCARSGWLPRGMWLAAPYGAGLFQLPRIVMRRSGSMSVELFSEPARPVLVDVRLPDGTQPARAFIVHSSWSSDYVSDSFHDEDISEMVTLWTPLDPVVARPSSRGDLAFVVAEPTGTWPGLRRPGCRYVSGVRNLSAAKSTVRFDLEVSASFEVLVEPPPGGGPEIEPKLLVQCIEPLRGREPLAFIPPVFGPCLDRLRQRDLRLAVEWWPGSRVSYAHKGRWRATAEWAELGLTRTVEFDVAPGNQGEQSDQGHQVVRIEQPEVPREAYVVVRPTVDGAKGALEPEVADLKLVAQRPEGDLVIDLAGYRHDGARWLLRSELNDPATGAWPTGADVHLVGRVVQQGDFGRGALVSAPLTSEAREVMLPWRHARAPKLALAESGGHWQLPNVEVEAQLLEAADPAIGAAVAGTERAHADWAGSVRASGGWTFFRRFASRENEVWIDGRWRFVFRADVPVMTRPLVVNFVQDCPHDGAEVKIVLPVGYGLSVHVPEAAAGDVTYLRREADDDAPETLLHEHLGADLCVTFESLLAGKYELRVRGEVDWVEVEVPSPPITHHPRYPNAFRIELTPLDDGTTGALAAAGFRTGDLLVRFDEVEVRAQDDLDAFINAIEARRVTAHVVRDGAALSLPLGPMVDPAAPWARFDADFVSARR
ncbi:MAG: hypothetical protein R3F49_01540 [Planctomycetota bacterium]